MIANSISVIVPTIGRPESLVTLFEALIAQTRRPDEVIVADGSDGTVVRSVAAAPRWRAAGLDVRYLSVQPPNAVAQRKAAIAQATGSLLLLLDDDVVPEPGCVEALVKCLTARGAVAVCADFSNHDWPPPTTLWRWYLRWRHGIIGRGWQGRVVGPLLRFGYNPVPPAAAAMDWMGAGHSLVRREAYLQAGGFSEFFLHRSTVNEDVDLGIKLRRQGAIYLCPEARMAHQHAPAGRASARLVAEDDLYNRYCVLHLTLGRSRSAAIMSVLIFFAIETLSGVFAVAKHHRGNGFGHRLVGRLTALFRIAAS